MPTAKLTDTATFADWDFLRDDHDRWYDGMFEGIWSEPRIQEPNPEIMAAIRQRTDKVAQRFEVSADDLFADTLLYMAVRPEATTDVDFPLLLWRIERVAATLAKSKVTRQAREESLEALLSGGDDQWPL